MIFYLTFNDLPSGIYSSQVIDVVNFLNKELKAGVKLVAFISLRNFGDNRKKIKKELPEALVLPMVPGLGRWKMNRFLFRMAVWFYRPRAIMGRSVLATQLALKARCRKVIYDGRGAISDEWKEYNVVEDERLRAQIYNLEKECVLESQCRLAVSHQLVRHWREEFGYCGEQHVVIPCTINKVFENLEINQASIADARKKMGISEEAVVCVYSGSLAGWQSFDLMGRFVKQFLKQSEKHAMLFLCERDQNIKQLEEAFPGRVNSIKVSPHQVPLYLTGADFGLLIREESVTNKVASPVKFAEYLACGLKVIISRHLGDYTEFVVKNNCGSIYTETVNATKPILAEKIRIKGLISDFKKQNHLKSYGTLLNAGTIN